MGWKKDQIVMKEGVKWIADVYRPDGRHGSGETRYKRPVVAPKKPTPQAKPARLGTPTLEDIKPDMSKEEQERIGQHIQKLINEN